MRKFAVRLPDQHRGRPVVQAPRSAPPRARDAGALTTDPDGPFDPRREDQPVCQNASTFAVVVGPDELAAVVCFCRRSETVTA